MSRWQPIAAIGLVLVLCAAATWLAISLVIAAGVGVYALGDSGSAAETGSSRARLTISTAPAVALAADDLAAYADRSDGAAPAEATSAPAANTAQAVTAPGVYTAPAATTTKAAATAQPATSAQAASSEQATASAPTSTLPAPVDFPELPDLTDREPLRTTGSFEVYADDPDDPLLVDLGETWAPELETLLDDGVVRVGQGLNKSPVAVVFARRYDARCPARGLASPLAEEPFISVYVDESTSDVQVRAVLAHEIGHHLTVRPGFVGDGVLTEGIASWAAEETMLEWLDITGWDDAVRGYLGSGDYVSITDDSALSPREDENCLERRDRVYTIRTAFVSWFIDRYGLETVLQMPSRQSRQADRVNGDEGDGSDPADGEQPATIEVPDYEAATGLDLGELEELWLQELREEDR